MNILNIQDRLLMQQDNGTAGSTGSTGTSNTTGATTGTQTPVVVTTVNTAPVGIEADALYTKQTGDGRSEQKIGSRLTQEEADSKLWTKIAAAGTFKMNADGTYVMLNAEKPDNRYKTLNNIFGKKGEGDNKKGGPTFSDLRALNALAANKIQRVPQSMPVSQMTRIDPLRRSSEMEKQKQDAQANANASRILGPKGSDPTLNVANSMGTTEQLNKNTMDANLQQSQSMSNQRGVQREQTDYANKVNVLNQNQRIEIRNAAEKEKAGNIATQRLANAQIGNTWLGAKEKEKLVEDQTNLALYDKYAQYAFNTDPANQDVIKEKAAAANADYIAKQETEAALAKLNEAKYMFKNAGTESKSKYEPIVTAAQTTYNEKKAISDATFIAFEAAKQKLEDRQIEFNNRVAKGEAGYAQNQNKVGYTGPRDNLNKLIDEIDKNTAPVKTTTNQRGGVISHKKGGANEALKQQYKIELENIRQNNRLQLIRETAFVKSLVLPEPKAYYLTIKMMAEKNKQINDMFKDAYKAFKLR